MKYLVGLLFLLCATVSHATPITIKAVVALAQVQEESEQSTSFAVAVYDQKFTTFSIRGIELPTDGPLPLKIELLSPFEPCGDASIGKFAPNQLDKTQQFTLHITDRPVYYFKLTIKTDDKVELNQRTRWIDQMVFKAEDHDESLFDVRLNITAWNLQEDAMLLDMLMYPTYQRWKSETEGTELHFEVDPNNLNTGTLTVTEVRWEGSNRHISAPQTLRWRYKGGGIFQCFKGRELVFEVALIRTPEEPVDALKDCNIDFDFPSMHFYIDDGKPFVSEALTSC